MVDHVLIRRGLRATLKREEDLVVVAEDGDGVRAVEAVLEHRPDILVLDLKLSDRSGLWRKRESG